MPITMPFYALIGAAALMALVGCAHNGVPCPPGTGTAQAQATPAWQDVVTDADHVHLRQWRQSFVAALAKAHAGGDQDKITHEGSLLDPDAALDGVNLPAGTYSCRTIKLGARAPAKIDFLALPPSPCTVRRSGGLDHFSWTAENQRPRGKLYHDDLSREVFLGVMVLGDERAPIKYGRDSDRDMVGSLQRIGANHWRLILPDTAWDSMMAVVDITPATR